MSEQILAAIVEMVKQGGTLAIWGILAWGGIQLLKIFLIGGTICLVLRMISRVFSECHSRQCSVKQEQVSLISKELEGRLLKTLKDYSESVNGILTDISLQLSGLKKESEKQEKK